LILKIFNTLTRKKEEFVPLKEGEVNIYSCGPTVYNLFHIGNARPFIIFDTLRRYFEYRGYKVNFVQNFTDIDDKLINRAREEGTTVSEIAKKYIEEYFIDAKGLNIKHATYHPKATENIDEIIKIIKTLEEKGFAYNLDGGVYFRAKKFDEYGKLSHMPLDELEAGVRKELDERKEDPMDFVLWKKQKSPDEPAWESPWGLGRPGWHIECSAMANRFLGKTIDIHCGGRDLIFPHHENEIAQSECANGVPFARYWMHNGFINIDNQKMSKSLNNFLLVRDLSKIYGYEAIRFFMLSAHYRSPINFSDELIKQSQAGLERLYNCIENLDFLISKSQSRGVSEEVKGQVEKYKNSFIEAMDDDLNTADAISVLFELAKYANTYCAGENLSKDDLVLFKETFMELGGVLGIFYSKKDETLDSEIEELINLRQKARSEKNFKEADRIRDLLKEKGIILLDTPQGVKWKRI